MDYEKTMGQKNLVSILMLTYNRAGFIGEAITSVLAQTYENWELIILDSGSTDNTAEIVRGFADERIRYVSDGMQTDLSVRRKQSLGLCHGAYVAVLDSDDVWSSPDKLRRQVTYLEANPDCGLVGTFIKLVNAKGEVIGTNQFQTDDEPIRRDLLRRNQFAHSSVMMRDSLLKQTAGYRDFPVAEDLDLFLQLGTVGTLANLPEFLTTYRIHPNSASSRKVLLITCVLAIISEYKNVYPGFYRAYLKYALYRAYLYFRSIIS